MLAGDDPFAVDPQAGQGRGCAPVASTTCRAADDLVADADLGGGDEPAAPSITSIRRLATRPVRPFQSRLTTLSL